MNEYTRHIFSAKHWINSRRKAISMRGGPYGDGYGRLAAINQMDYLTEVFSWLWEVRATRKAAP